MGYELPEEILSRFRRSALERLGAVDRAWGTLSRGEYDPELERELHRHVHTLKGDARVVGFTDVNHLCQKLEDLLFFASQRRFRVPDEVDCLVTMALQFVGMLVRKKAGASLGGIDLAGFTREIEEALRDAAAHAPASDGRLEPEEGEAAAEDGERLSNASRQRLAREATLIFLESLRVPSPSAERLRRSWRAVAETLRALDGTPLEPALARHRAATLELAKQLGKQITLEWSVCAARVSEQVADALGVALLHGAANAVDHGIEAPAQRRAAGKAEAARLCARVRELPNSLELTVEDDGAGVDLDGVRRRAVALGLFTEAQAREASVKVLCDVLFHPGFSTREEVGEVSGRGIGLNAVKAAVVKLGGTVEIRSELGRGTTLRARVPRTAGQLTVQRVVLAAGRTPIALPANARLSPLDASNAGDADDLDAVLALRSGPSGAADAVRPLLVRAGARRLRLLACSTPALTTADRLCPTGEGDPFEVVSIAGVEALLIRPEVLPARAESAIGASAALEPERAPLVRGA